MLTRLFKQSLNFKCTASACTDSCCTGWGIPLDEATYEKLKNDPRFKKTMTEYTYINDYMTQPNINYAIIDCKDNDRCPFLDTENLCDIQKSNGERGLSSVCALYPRYYNTVDGVYEESLSLACIEATEKLLLGSPLELIEIHRGPKRDVVMQTIITEDGKVLCSKDALHTFRHRVFDLIRDEAYTFEQKLEMLIAFHEHTQDMDEYKLKEALVVYNFSNKEATSSIDNVLYKKLILFLKKVGKTDHDELDQLIDDCIGTSSYQSLHLQELTKIDGIMSNYLIHQMFKDLYPCITHNNKMGSFQSLLVKVQILRLLIAFDGHFDNKRVARIIQMFSKGLEHHAVFHHEIGHVLL